MKYCFLIAVLQLIGLFKNCYGQEKWPTDKSDYTQMIVEINKEVEEKMSKYKVLGVSIGLVDDQSIILAKGYGYTDTTYKIPVNKT